MSGIRVRGGQLLHGLWSHAERAVLQGGRPPPPPGGAQLRAGARQSIRTHNGHSTLNHSSGVKYRSSDRTKSFVPDSLFCSVKSFAEDAFTAVFKGVHRPVHDSAGAAQVRAMMRASSRGKVDASPFAKGSFHRQAKRHEYVPRVSLPVKGNTARVGLQLANNFHSGGAQFVVHAPLALRAAVDELEDDIQMHMRLRSKRGARIGAKRSHEDRAGLVPSKLDSYMPIKATAPTMTAHTKDMWESSMSSSTETIGKVSSSSKQTLDSLVECFEELPESCFAYSTPSISTQLHVPLSPDLEMILTSQQNRDIIDDHSLDSFVRGVGAIHDAFNDLRRRRIMVIERAFDQEPLRRYRPSCWTADMFVELSEEESHDFVRTIGLRVDFPGKTRDDVQEMLSETMGPESVQYFSQFLFENRADGLRTSDSTGGSEQFSFLGSPEPSIVDLGDEVRGMGPASVLSMDDYQDASHGPTFAIPMDLRMPMLEIGAGRDGQIHVLH